MQSGIRLTDGPSFESSLFGLPDEKVLSMIGHYRPVCFRQDVGGLVRFILDRYPQEGFPKTPFATKLYSRVKRSLESFGIEADGLRILSLLGTDADRYYETDALLYLPESCGYECVVTIDARLINLDLTYQLRDYWIESSKDESIYSEDQFQKDIFAHNRIIAEHYGLNQESFRRDWFGHWILSEGYKQLWDRAYIPAIPDEMIDRPMLMPTNHLLITSYHLEKPWRMKSIERLIAFKFCEQIFPHFS